MNGDMIEAGGDLKDFCENRHALGFIPMVQTGAISHVKIEGLTEQDFAALLKTSSDYKEELGHNLILGEQTGEVRLFWHNDIGDSVCWRFPEKKRDAVKTAVLADIASFKKASAKKGLF